MLKEKKRMYLSKHLVSKLLIFKITKNKAPHFANDKNEAQ